MDPLITWAIQDHRPGIRVWRRPGAVAVACSALARRDRIAVSGEPAAVADLLAGEVLPATGPDHRPFGDEDLVAAVAERLPELTMAGTFGWMDTAVHVRATRPYPVAWLPGDDGVRELLDAAFPASYARPGGDGVHRWAGVTGAGGLLAVAAEAWSSSRIGFLGGVATAPDARGRGLASAVCAFVTGELLPGRERVALFVDHDNTVAIRTYEKLGFTLRRLGVAHRVPVRR